MNDNKNRTLVRCIRTDASPIAPEIQTINNDFFRNFFILGYTIPSKNKSK